MPHIVFSFNLDDVIFIILALLLAGLLGFIKLADWQEKRKNNHDRKNNRDGKNN